MYKGFQQTEKTGWKNFIGAVVCFYFSHSFFMVKNQRPYPQVKKKCE
jgi:hypothetical protein